MDYTNEHGVRFKLVHRGTNTYTVKYYPGSGKAWPRTYRMFHCPTDECRSEMFYMLSHSRLCTTCQDEILDYRVDVPLCKGCILRKAQETGLNEESIPECPVCYQKMLVVDNSKHTLPCRHEVCKGCFRRMLKMTPHVHYNGYRPTQVGVITCPLCRQEAFYDFSSFRQVHVNNTI